MKVIDGGIVVASRSQTDRQSCAFPNICVLPGGRWICGFRAAPTKAATTGQHALITWSDDQGRTWSEPIAPFVPPKVEGKPDVIKTSDGSLLAGFWCTANFVMHVRYVRLIID